MKISYSGKIYNIYWASVIIGVVSFVIFRIIYLRIFIDSMMVVYLICYIFASIASGYIAAIISNNDLEFNSLVVGLFNGILLLFDRLAWFPSPGRIDGLALVCMVLATMYITYVGAALRLRKISKGVITPLDKKNL